MATVENAEKKFLDTCSHRDHRSLAGLCHYVSEMRHDASFATQEVLRDASHPTMEKLAKSQENRPIPQRSTATSEFPLDNEKNKHSDSHG